MKKNILIYTKTGGIYGSGHFVRMKILMRYIKSSLNIDTVFLIEDSKDIDFKKENIETIEFENIKKEEIFLIIVDKRKTDSYKIKKLKDIAPVIIIDSKGNERVFADIVIEMMPSISDADKNVNIFPYYATILNTSKLKYALDGKVLLYLGDNYEAYKNIIEAIKHSAHIFVFVVKDENILKNIGVKKEDYKNIIFTEYGKKIFNYKYSHAITYFGLTAFEAVTKNISTMLYPITDYHNALSKKCDDLFFIIENIKDIDKLKESIEYFLSEKSYAKKTLHKENAKKINTENAILCFRKIILHTENFNNIKCPACKNKTYKLVYRNKESNLYLCRKCKTLFRKYFLDILSDTEYDFYGKNYFESDYKKQYGKTYKEDEENLSRLARERIEKIKKIKTSGRILDLGSAMGFFIKEALAEGFDASGVEISKYACNYSKLTGLNVANTSLEDFNYEENKYDVISMWYVLEHIENLQNIMKKIKYALKENGLFAIATPSSYGLTGRFNKEHYYSIVPKDHSAEFSINSIDIFLKSYGFEKINAENKSLYLERALKIFNIDFKILKTKPFKKLYNLIGKIFNLGDTFECIYLLKKK